MDVTNMPLDDARYWLAVDDGWTLCGEVDEMQVWERGSAAENNYEQCTDPYPATLDGAAAALPKGWEWMRWYTQDDRDWVGWRLAAPMVGAVIQCTGNETLDRFRLGVKCRMVAKGGK